MVIIVSTNVIHTKFPSSIAMKKVWKSRAVYLQAMYPEEDFGFGADAESEQNVVPADGDLNDDDTNLTSVDGNFYFAVWNSSVEYHILIRSLFSYCLCQNDTSRPQSWLLVDIPCSPVHSTAML